MYRAEDIRRALSKEGLHHWKLVEEYGSSGKKGPLLRRADGLRLRVEYTEEAISVRPAPGCRQNQNWVQPVGTRSPFGNRQIQDDYEVETRKVPIGYHILPNGAPRWVRILFKSGCEGWPVDLLLHADRVYPQGERVRAPDEIPVEERRMNLLWEDY